jgi:hypothetical protein
MDAWLNQVLSQIAEGTLLPAEYFRQLDCDAALDARDHDEEFDSGWATEFDSLEQLWKQAPPPADIVALAEDVRRESFLAVSNATQQHEIASYVSDDFDLIVKCRLLGVEIDFVQRLWDSYACGEFPSPPL